MLRLLLLAALSLAGTLPALAQTTTAPKQVTEVTEDIDPATGKVIRRTTRTTTEADKPAGTTTTAGPASVAAGPASDAVVSDFFREKTVVSRLSANELTSAYSRFIEKVRNERRGWQPTDWANAASVLSSLNGRYEQLRNTLVLDDKVNIRTTQAEFQALRTARQVTEQVSDKL